MSADLERVLAQGADDISSTMSCDVLVIGSGAGGATTAALLAEAGFDVIVVEEGTYTPPGSVSQFSLAQMDAQYRNGGVTAAVGRPVIAYTEGCCIGGGTEVNSGLYRRPPEEVLHRWRTGWSIDDFGDDEIFSIADEIEEAISVSPVPGPATPASQRLADGARSRGWKVDESPRWMRYPADGGVLDGVRQSMCRTYLPRAVEAGARILASTRVLHLRISGGRAHVAVVERSRPDASVTRSAIRFRDVVVCGGAIQTPALLQRSGLRHNIGRTLAMHPTVKLAARFPDVTSIPDDIPVHQVKEFAPGLSFGGSASGPGLVALSMSDNWHSFGSASDDWQRVAVYYAAITSEGRGRVVSVPGARDPFVTYRLTGRDRQLLSSGLSRLSHLLLGAGAEEIYPGYRDAPIIRGSRDLADMYDRFSVNRATVMTVHLCSTVPMGEDDRRCAADSSGLVYGTANVFVNDASLLPDAPGVNPQGSIMALAIRNARRLIRERGRG